MINIKIKLGKDAVLPVNANESDTGYDVVAATEPNIVGNRVNGTDLWTSIDYIEYDSNIQVSPEIRNTNQPIQNEYSYLSGLPRSSISKYNLVLANSDATIDNGYRGNIKFRFKYISQPDDLVYENNRFYIRVNRDKVYKKGDKIAQLVGRWKESVVWKVVENLEESQRGEGGFGSTGK